MQSFKLEFRATCLLCLLVFVTACANTADEEPRARPPTDAEVEAYNAQVPPDEQIICRREIPVGTFIPKRVCRLMVDVEDTSNLHRDQLRRVLQ